VSSGVVYFIWNESGYPHCAVVPRSEIRQIESRTYGIDITLNGQSEDVSISVDPQHDEPVNVIKRMFSTLMQSVDTDITWTQDEEGDWGFVESRPT
jgi:hypothetical protein